MPPGSFMTSIYTSVQLIRALSCIKRLDIPPAMVKLAVAQAPDGTCVVTLAEDRREPSLNMEMVVKLTADEVRAWRAECHALVGEDTALLSLDFSPRPERA